MLLGSRIRMYRLALNMSLQDFADRLHKSASAVSKYESGDIVINIDILYEIAGVLGVSAPELLSAVKDQKSGPSGVPGAQGPGSQAAGATRTVCSMYQYSKSDDKILRSLIEHYGSPAGDQFSVTIFYDVPSFSNLAKCKSLYRGSMKKDGFIYNYQMTNMNNPTEHVFLCCLKSFDATCPDIGLLVGLSSKSLHPEAVKVIISDNPLNEGAELKELLLIDADDIRHIKRDNYLVLTK